MRGKVPSLVEGKRSLLSTGEGAKRSMHKNRGSSFQSKHRLTNKYKAHAQHSTDVQFSYKSIVDFIHLSIFNNTLPSNPTFSFGSFVMLWKILYHNCDIKRTNFQSL